MSKHYFVGAVPQGKIIEQDIPIFGFQTGKTVMNPWPSVKAETRDEFKDLTIVVNPQVSLHFAMPKKTALMFFPINKKYEKVTLDAYKPNSGGYMSGSVIRIVFTAVSNFILKSMTFQYRRVSRRDTSKQIKGWDVISLSDIP